MSEPNSDDIQRAKDLIHDALHWQKDKPISWLEPAYQVIALEFAKIRSGGVPPHGDPKVISLIQELSAAEKESMDKTGPLTSRFHEAVYNLCTHYGIENLWEAAPCGCLDPHIEDDGIKIS